MMSLVSSRGLAPPPTHGLSGASCLGVVGLLRICSLWYLVISQQDFRGVDCGPVKVGGTQAKMTGEGSFPAYRELPPPFNLESDQEEVEAS